MVFQSSQNKEHYIRNSLNLIACFDNFVPKLKFKF